MKLKPPTEAAKGNPTEGKKKNKTQIVFTMNQRPTNSYTPQSYRNIS